MPKILQHFFCLQLKGFSSFVDFKVEIRMLEEKTLNLSKDKKNCTFLVD